MQVDRISLVLRLTVPEEILQRHIESIIEEHGMNDPYPVQYFHWVSELLKGNWGWSPVLRADVLDVLLKRTPATMELTVYSLLLFIPLGLIMCSRSRSVVSGSSLGR